MGQHVQTDLPLAPPSLTRPTSREVFEQIRKDGTLAGARLRVVEILAEANEPLTGAEVDARDKAHESGSFRGHCHKRLPELRALGVVVVGDVRKCRITGKRATTWALSGNLPSAPRERKQTSASRIADLEKENAKLARRVRELEREVAKLRQPGVFGVLDVLFTNPGG